MKKFEFKPFQKVLVRDNEGDVWRCSLYSRISENIYYCINGYWEQCIPYEGNEQLLGTTDPYVEPYEPQKGDFIAFGDLEGDKRALQIIKSFKKDCSHSAYVTLPICLDTRDYEEKVDIGEDFEYSNINIRPATEEEKQLLLSKLHENGKDWDAENKEIVDWKWKPNYGEIYYYPSFKLLGCSFDFNTSAWRNDSLDFNRMKINFVFKTEEECQAMCDKLNEAIKNVK